MKDESRLWLQYAEENFGAAKQIIENGFFNPGLQNCQQSIEKALKALLVEYSLPLKRTHNILELKQIVSKSGISVDITDDECRLIDSIYLPSKYPLGSALPDAEPDRQLCDSIVAIVSKLFVSVKNILG